MIFKNLKRHKRRSSIPWFRKRLKTGTIYLMRSVEDPDLFKVGFTERLSNTRRKELERHSGHCLRIFYTLSMPHAYICEQRLHRFYRRRFFGRASELGTEWYRLRSWENIDGVKNRMNRMAVITKMEARLKFSWPADRIIREYSA